MAEEEIDTLAASVAAEQEKETTKEDATEETKDGTEQPEGEDEQPEETVAAGEDGEQSSEPEKPTKKSASDTIRALKAERNTERLEREKLISELAAAKAIEHEREQQRNAAASAAERRAEEDRLALLDPSERAAYAADQRSRSLEQKINLMQLQIQDSTDRAVFRAKAAYDPLIEKYADMVEDILQSDRKKGYAASREEYLNFIVGREVRKDAAAKLSAKKDSAAKRIDTVTSKPASARGDVAGSKKGKSEEDRLRGVLI